MTFHLCGESKFVDWFALTPLHMQSCAHARTCACVLVQVEKKSFKKSEDQTIPKKIQYRKTLKRKGIREGN